MKYTFRNDGARVFPEMVHVDLTTACNYRCIHCPQGDREGWKDPRPLFMKKGHFQAVAREVSDHRAILRITCSGEPCLHPDVKEFLEFLAASDIPVVTITTNGSLWDEGLTEIVLQPSSVKWVVDFSLDALFRETYAHIRRGGDYACVLKNVLNLIETRNRLKADHLYVMVNAIDQPEARQEIPLFRRFWEGLADRVIVRRYVNAVGLVGKLSGPVDEPPPERWPCSLLWRRMVVNSKGQFMFCVDDWNGASSLQGKTVDQVSIARVWQAPEYEALRRDHAARRFSHPLCARCDANWVGLSWDYDYRTALEALFRQGQSR